MDLPDALDHSLVLERAARPLAGLALVADLSAAASSGTDLDVLRSASPLVHAAVGGVLLLIATILAVFKPQGMTRYGQRRRQQRRQT